MKNSNTNTDIIPIIILVLFISFLWWSLPSGHTEKDKFKNSNYQPTQTELDSIG